jgi:hypothetical protein
MRSLSLLRRWAMPEMAWLDVYFSAHGFVAIGEQICAFREGIAVFVFRMLDSSEAVPSLARASGADRTLEHGDTFYERVLRFLERQTSVHPSSLPLAKSGSSSDRNN